MNTKIKWLAACGMVAGLLAGFSGYGQETEIGKTVRLTNSLALSTLSNSFALGVAPDDEAVLPVLVPLDREKFVRVQEASKEIGLESRIQKELPIRPLLLSGTAGTMSMLGTNAPWIGGGSYSGSNSCVGKYYGFARFTNTTVSPPSIWWRPPTGTTSGTIADASGITDPAYVPVVEVVRRSDLRRWCGTNSVTFPASNLQQYQFSTYIKNIPPPPNSGQILYITLQWQ